MNHKKMNNNQELLEIIHVDQSELACNIEIKCEHKERSLSYALRVKVPIPAENPEIAFAECCYKHFVFADINSSEDFKNDYSSFFHQRQLSNETVVFILYHYETDTEYELNSGVYGLNFDYGSFDKNKNLKGFLVQWKKVLETIGEGNFKVVKKQTVAGIEVEFNSIVFTLKQFSVNAADRTVRIDVVMDGRLNKSGVDFSGTSWKHSIRVPGFFGRREPGIEEDNLISKDYEKKQIVFSFSLIHFAFISLLPSSHLVGVPTFIEPSSFLALEATFVRK